MTEQNKLKACPFCGGEGVMQTMRGGEDTMLTFVQCKSCEATQEAVEDAYSDPATAAMRWNTRTGETEQNKAGSELDRLNGCAVALGFSDVSELVERAADNHLIALSRPTQTADAVEVAAKRAYSVACRQRSLTMPWDGLSDNGKSEWLEVTRAALSHTATSEVEPLKERLVLRFETDGEDCEQDAELIMAIDRAVSIHMAGRFLRARAERTESGRMITLEHNVSVTPSPPTPTPDSGLATELAAEEGAHRHDDKARNVILNTASIDLSGIVSNFDPEIDHLGDKVWDRLDKLACEIEAHTALQSNSDSELLREAKWKLGDKLTKKSGSKWRGTVVGFYSTELTPIGYAIESDTETGSVQIYPEKALARLEQGAA